MTMAMGLGLEIVSKNMSDKKNAIRKNGRIDLSEYLFRSR